MRSGGHIVRFGEFTFDSETRQLTRDGKHIHLSPKAFELLSVLVRNRPRAMSKAELQEDLWPATFVSESNLPGLVKEIRRAVGPEIAATVVRTVHGYGYSFAANAQEATGCDVNSAGNEASPFLVHAPGGPALYFSSNVAGGYSAEADGVITGDDDIYRSEWQAGTFQARQLVDGVNSPANDSRPNLSHDGQEIIFDSNRPGTLGGPDIFYAFRDHPNDSWSAPQNVGPNVNTESAETRASMSWDGTVLVFGSNRPGGEGMADIYMATRIRLTGTR